MELGRRRFRASLWHFELSMEHLALQSSLHSQINVPFAARSSVGVEFPWPELLKLEHDPFSESMHLPTGRVVVSKLMSIDTALSEEYNAGAAGKGGTHSVDSINN